MASSPVPLKRDNPSPRLKDIFTPDSESLRYSKAHYSRLEKVVARNIDPLLS